MKKFFIILAAVAMVGIFAGTAMATDWDFYGSARMGTFYTQVSDAFTSGTYANGGYWMNNPLGNNTDPKPAGAEGFSETMFTTMITSRFGGSVTAGDVYGRVELRPTFGASPTRLLYGKWNFGAGSMTVGQDYTPLNMGYGRSAMDTGAGDGGIGGDAVGQLYDSRNPQIRFDFQGFKIAFVTPGTGGITTGGGYVNQKILLPKIAASYKYSADMWFAEVNGGYQTLDYVNATDQSKSVSAYTVGLGGGFNFAGGDIKAAVLYAMNAECLGLSGDQSIDTNGAVATAAGFNVNPAFVYWDGSDYSEVSTMSFYLDGQYKFTDMVALGAGFGYRTYDNELKGTTNAKFENAVMGGYVNVPITLAKGVYIVPEVGMVDYGDLKEKNSGIKSQLGNFTYFGAKWQIDF